ncbi:hypothetical protein ACFSTE_19685 [Aquimarina hainanensis]|uniref:DUF4252 domain-containing protein n=1 Tax=Aquimarina hainanensis TaxID=1578017 RepID=A0ABW5NDW2_9FLAO|nr:hypothetical protein [Aquimarina sp. TRL1]QKX06455.1 hypothetical protein HN014_16555 [Aquimarina sp. TRL1]
MCNLKISLVLFFITSTLVHCQSKKTSNEEMITSFFNTVYKSNIPSDDLYKQYFFEDSNAIEIRDRIMKLFRKHIVHIKSKKNYLLNTKSEFEVENYSQSKRTDLVKFIENDDKENIYFLTVDNKIEFYVLLKQNKIYSFEYVKKGGEGLFIAYY